MFVPHRKHTCRPPRPVKCELYFFIYRWCSYLTGNISFTFLFVDDVRNSQETHVWASAVWLGVISTFVYVDDVCTSQEAHLLPGQFTFFLLYFVYHYSSVIRRTVHLKQCMKFSAILGTGPLQPPCHGNGSIQHYPLCYSHLNVYQLIVIWNWLKGFFLFQMSLLYRGQRSVRELHVRQPRHRSQFMRSS
jgi:hypothetical protein